MPLVKPPSPVLQRGHPLAKGLVAAWPFFEGGGGSLNDLSGNRNTGILTNGPAWTGGQFGSALLFTAASSQSVIVPNSASFNFATLTLSAWFRTTTTGADQDLLRQDGNPSGTRNWGFRVSSGNNLQAFTIFGGVPILTSAATVTDGKWHHGVLILKQNGGNTDLTLYLDGQSVATGTATALNPTPTQSVYIGYSEWAEPFNGSIDAVSFYNRALSAAEVEQLYFDPFVIYRTRSRWWESLTPTYYFPGKSAIVKPVSPVLQRDNPLANGMVLAWLFSEGSGNSAYNYAAGLQLPAPTSGTGNPYTGLFTGTWAGGPSGSTVHTDSSTEVLFFSNTALTPPNIQTGDFTVAVRFLLTTLGSYTPIFDANDAALNRMFSLFVNAGGGAGHVYWAAGGSVGSDGIPIGQSIAVNTWYDLTVTRKGSLSSFYINGSLSGTNSAQTSTSAWSGAGWNKSISVGGNPSAGGTREPTNYDYFYLWNRALSAAEVAQLCFDPFATHRPRSRWWEVPTTAAAARTPYNPWPLAAPILAQ
jgi:hypothetical protein